MHDGPFDHPLAGRVVQRGPGFPQEQGQLLPVVLHIVEGIAQGGIGFHQLPLDLLLEPGLQLFHERLAPALVVGQSGFRVHAPDPGAGVDPVDQAKESEDDPYLPREFRFDFHESAPGMDQAVGHESVRATFIPRMIGGQRITHLDRPVQALGPELQNRLQVLPGVLHACKVQGDPMLPHVGEDGRRLDRLAAFLLHREHPLQDPNGRVVVVQEQAGGGQHPFPLGGNGERDSEGQLQALDAMVGDTRSVAPFPDQGGHAGVEFLFTHPCGNWRGELLFAQIAPPPLQFIDGCPDGGHARHPDQGGRILLGLDLALAARRWTGISTAGSLPGHLLLPGARIGPGPVPPVPWNLCPRLSPGVLLASRRARFPADRGCGFRPGTEQDVAQPVQGRALALHLLVQEGQGVHRLLEVQVGFLSQGLCPTALQVAMERPHVQGPALQVRAQARLIRLLSELGTSHPSEFDWNCIGVQAKISLIDTNSYLQGLAPEKPAIRPRAATASRPEAPSPPWGPRRTATPGVRGPGAAPPGLPPRWATNGTGLGRGAIGTTTFRTHRTQGA